ncbi:MAG: 50S ribosomal protein L22 [Microthrixaceae bacterium]
MTGTKTNERPGVRAQHRHARMSATKARVVLDLIRNKPVGEARTILEFCDRAAAEPIAKVLDSAVANAGNNNDIPPEELFVATAYADEGPTLKRWRPRARGRATRIRKRTCHITIVVGRFSVEELDRLRERQASTGRARPDAATARARRVARSKAAAAEAEAEENADETATDAVVEDAEAPETTAETAAEDTTAADTGAEAAEAEEAAGDEEATEATLTEDAATDDAADEDAADEAPRGQFDAEKKDD